MYLFKRKCGFFFLLSFFLVFPFPSSFRAKCSKANSLFSHLREPGGSFFCFGNQNGRGNACGFIIVLSGCVLGLVLSPSWLLWLGPLSPGCVASGPGAFESACLLLPCNPGMWASPPLSRRSSPRPRASGISFCPPLPLSQVGLRLDDLHLHREFRESAPPEPPSLGESTDISVWDADRLTFCVFQGLLRTWEAGVRT